MTPTAKRYKANGNLCLLSSAHINHGSSHTIFPMHQNLVCFDPTSRGYAEGSCRSSVHFVDEDDVVKVVQLKDKITSLGIKAVSTHQHP